MTTGVKLDASAGQDCMSAGPSTVNPAVRAVRIACVMKALDRVLSSTQL
jgi:hypothetical protein